MDVFAVRLNADLRHDCLPYSRYPTKAEYKAIHAQGVGDGFHEAANFLDEGGLIRGYLPPRHIKEIRESENFVLVSVTYKSDGTRPNRVFGIQLGCVYVGHQSREGTEIEDLTYHYACFAENSILLPQGVQAAYEKLLGADKWLQGHGPVRRIDQGRFVAFVKDLSVESAVEISRPRLEMCRNQAGNLFQMDFSTGVRELEFNARVDDLMVSKIGRVIGNEKPGVRTVTTTQRDRDPRVAALARQNANGKCDDCKQDAPFLSKRSGLPYLEVHHIVTLAKGGPDTPENTIALCPNCHRKRHHG